MLTEHQDENLFDFASASRDIEGCMSHLERSNKVGTQSKQQQIKKVMTMEIISMIQSSISIDTIGMSHILPNEHLQTLGWHTHTC